MDLLKGQIKNLNLYEVKHIVRKAQNVVYNYTEMEAKVREATNNEPWGTSSSLMQQIAAGTYNYREREEICGLIFRRFTEKSANEWRQIYKALQLLEYLVKNGSERIVDDARSNMSLIGLLKGFHYIDSQGKDQGINVRNRAKLLLELLSDENKIRGERKKARENARKFGGVAGGSSVRRHHNSSNSYSSYDFDEDTGYGTADINRVYGDGGVYGQRFEEHITAGSNNRFEEYDVTTASNSNSTSKSNSNSSIGKPKKSRHTPKQKSVQQKPQADLFSFDDDVDTNNNTLNKKNNVSNDDDDDFDDFQSAVPATTTTTSTTTQKPPQQPLTSSNLSDLFSLGSLSTPQQTNSNPTNNFSPYQPHTTQNQFSNFNYNNQPNSLLSFNNNNNPSLISTTNTATNSTASKPSSDAFSSLFSSAKTYNFNSQPQRSHSVSKPISTISKQNNSNSNSNSNSNNIDDLFGDFTSQPTSNTQSNNVNKSNTKNNNSQDLDLLSF
ncbi:Ent3p [Ascoidea rubescens DSM 1968]|uniref:ENTH-domain-containing protein n=1 Tax=Ascoidea rubescens DSM 1968 TaxID=1344418 RepID=A0A1D2VA78_9ASCO|nr:ENTH-domain-containing protein [Ascoidea rubescens DSM 1968]ODV58558.1 ENTH-domain-containing protein [Ascoidea rubescens DSM 1968]